VEIYVRKSDVGTIVEVRIRKYFYLPAKSQEGKCYAVEGENQYHAVFGGSPCMAVCASDMATALLALDARLETIDSDGGRTLKIENLYNFLGNNLKTDEIITKIQVPSAWIGAKQQFLKFRIRKTIDFSIVSVAVSIKLKSGLVDDARIAIGGVSWMPIRATQAEQVLIGRPLNERSAIIAARTAVEDATPSNKNEYKIPIVEALLKRALMNEMKESEI